MNDNRDTTPNIGEGVQFDRFRRQESDVGFEEIRSEYRPNENLISNTK